MFSQTLRKAGTDSWVPMLIKWGVGIAIAGVVAVGAFFLMNNGKNNMIGVGNNAFLSASNSSAFAGGATGSTSGGTISG